MGFFRKETEMRERLLAMSRKKDRSDLTLFIPFLLVHDYLFDDPTSLEYICKGFQVILLYIRGKSYGPSIFKLPVYRDEG